MDFVVNDCQKRTAEGNVVSYRPLTFLNADCFHSSNNAQLFHCQWTGRDNHPKKYQSYHMSPSFKDVEKHSGIESLQAGGKIVKGFFDFCTCAIHKFFHGEPYPQKCSSCALYQLGLH